MANIFDSVKVNRVKTSTFDLSHDVKLSFDMGNLVPILCMETLPGDKFKISNETLIRFQPMVAPVMHRMDVFVHYFFVPNRLTWAGWENFVTQTKTGGVLPAPPTITAQASTYTKLMDYLGIPEPTGLQSATINALPFAAYQKIFEDYYRDQNLYTEQPIVLQDGSNNAQVSILNGLRKRAWEKDYFTSALPFAQKGDAVGIPIDGTVSMDPTWDGNSGAGPFPHFIKTTGANASTGALSAATSGGQPIIHDTAFEVLGYDPEGSLILDGAGTTTMEDLRQANALQRFLEKMGRGGSRINEYIKNIFDVNTDDARLQRPEYITGTKSPVVISEVLNTTGTTDAPQGQMAGHGISVGASNKGFYHCKEHGYIIGIMSVLPKPAYMQGIPKHFLKTDAFDYGTPDFANLGEQPIVNQEIYAYQGAADNDTFGYTPRYAEYKFEPNRVAGDFRTTLDFWHLARKFATPPALNSAFVEMNPTAADRIFAVTDPNEEKLLGQVFNKVTAVRPLPKFGTPTF